MAEINYYEKKQKKEIEVRLIGEPSIETLTEAEQQVFYSTLLKRITELKAEDDKRKAEENYADNT